MCRLGIFIPYLEHFLCLFIVILQAARGNQPAVLHWLSSEYPELVAVVDNARKTAAEYLPQWLIPFMFSRSAVDTPAFFYQISPRLRVNKCLFGLQVDFLFSHAASFHRHRVSQLSSLWACVYLHNLSWNFFMISPLEPSAMRSLTLSTRNFRSNAANCLKVRR